MGVRVKERVDDPGAWWLYIDHQGKRKAKRVGIGPRAKKAAELAAVQLRARLAQGDLSVFAEAPAPVHMTFEIYARKWLAETITPHRKDRRSAKRRGRGDGRSTVRIFPLLGVLMISRRSPRPSETVRRSSIVPA